MRGVVLYGVSPRMKRSQSVQWAIEKINEYHYRKEFGLSKEEMLNEPMEDVVTNSKIMEFINIKEEKSMKKAQRKHGRRKR